MSKITYITPDGTEVVVENAAGNLMEIAIANQVNGIEGDCGGVCSCATCHIKIDPAWIEKTGKASETENDLLEWEDEFDETSRLGCQIEMNKEFDGLVVRVVGQ